MSLKPTVGRWGTVRRTALAAASSAALAVAVLAISPTSAEAQSCQWGTGRNGSAHQQVTAGDCYLLGARHYWYVNAIGNAGWTEWNLRYDFPDSVKDSVRPTYDYGEGQGYTP